MYALIVPASTPFVLLATVMGLSWWEDHILPTPPTAPVPDAAAVALPVIPEPAAPLTANLDRYSPRRERER
jgi:hypothetical protein